MATVPAPTPTLTDLREAAAVFNGYRDIDGSWLRFVADTAPAADLSRADHRDLLVRWLNSWGCRIRYPRPGEPPLLDEALAHWWDSWQAALPAANLSRLSDPEIDALAAGYADLAAAPVSPGPRGRSLAPTAAAKALYAMRPHTVMPWDAAIATRMYGARDAAAFARHLRTGRDWAIDVLRTAEVDESAVPALVGRPTVSLAKILDEYLYCRFTRQ